MAYPGIAKLRGSLKSEPSSLLARAEPEAAARALLVELSPSAGESWVQSSLWDNPGIKVNTWDPSIRGVELRESE